MSVMKSLLFFFTIVLILTACQAKPEQTDDSQNIATISPMNDLSSVDQHGAARKASVKNVLAIKGEENDSTEVDDDRVECYMWANTYIATSIVEDEEGDQFELNVVISLKDQEYDRYTGTISIYLEGSENQMLQGTVSAVAQRNYVTVVFEDDIDGMEELFKKGEKLVKFEISYGEYVASWYSAMNDFVDEHTVLSLQQ